MLPDKYWINNIESYYYNVNFLEKNSDTCIIILNFNNINYLKKLVKSLELVDCDILIVENNSKDGSYEFLYQNYKNRFNLIQTNKNLGGAGGFGLGIQWVIENGYEYCFVIEEDALPMKGNEDIFVEMLKYKNKNRIVKAKFYEIDTDSFTLHYTIYPIWILKNVGTVNKDLFFRADDQEWGMRIYNYIRKNVNNIEIKVVDKYYTHPLIKKGFGIMANYFSFRNAFLVYLKYPNKNFVIDYLINFIKYCSYSIFCYLYVKNKAVCKQFFYALYDFCKNDLPKNHLRINQFQEEKL